MKMKILHLLQNNEIKFTGTALECARWIKKSFGNKTTDRQIACHLHHCQIVGEPAYGFKVLFKGDYRIINPVFYGVNKYRKLKTKKPVIELPEYKPPKMINPREDNGINSIRNNDK